LTTLLTRNIKRVPWKSKDVAEEYLQTRTQHEALLAGYLFGLLFDPEDGITSQASNQQVVFGLFACLAWLLSSLACYSTLKMEAKCSSETSIYLYWYERCYIPEDNPFSLRRARSAVILPQGTSFLVQCSSSSRVMTVFGAVSLPEDRLCGLVVRSWLQIQRSGFDFRLYQIF
jgi:hypothetical protein